MLFRVSSLIAACFLLAAMGVGCGPECPEGQTKCGEVCIDTQFDRNNCGACDKKCGAGEVCSAGACSLSCQKGLTKCGTSCADTVNDSSNCGGCDNKCKTGEVCNKGKCEVSCPAFHTACGGKCIATKDNANHCGACDKKCDPGQICKDSKCEIVCAKGTENCSDKCVNTKVDRSNCGSCGTTCDPGQVCNDGICALTCNKDLKECNKTCVNTKTDSANCGACDNACKATEICKDGKCELNCSDGYADCKGLCINIKESRLNCGACDKKCADGEICKDGKCELNCPTGLGVCGGACVNLQGDPKNCGTCGTTCKKGEFCDKGKCTFYCQKGYSECTGTCADLQNDAKNCGACGTACKPGEVCATGKCVKPCPSGAAPCNNVCVDYKKDASNCGTCGNACGAGEVCLSGKCEQCSDCPLWVQNAGAFNSEYIRKVAVDSAGNVYAIGYFTTIAQFGKNIIRSNGGTDIFVIKLSPNGDYMWVKNAGGSSTDYGYGIGVDSSDNVYLSGSFTGSAKFGSIGVTSKGSSDAFVAKMDKTGKWLWVKSWGGTSSDEAVALAVDKSGNSHISGYFNGSMVVGTTTLSSKGSSDIFAARLDKDGNVNWSIRAGDTSADYSEAIAIDSSSNIYITGRFQKTAVFGTTTLSANGSYDVFVAKYTSAGALSYATVGGGASSDYSFAIAVDSKGNAYISGYFTSGGTVLGSTTLKSVGGNDMYLAKLDTTGKWGWATAAGTTSSDVGYAIAIDSKDNVYVTGQWGGAGNFGAVPLKPKGGIDIFLGQFDSAGKIVGASIFGSSGTDQGWGMLFDSKDNFYLCGNINPEAFFGKKQAASGGSYDGFVAKFAKLPATLCPSGTSVCGGKCTPTEADDNNCGACGKKCTNGETCQNSVCKCPPGYTSFCGTGANKVCANLQSDPKTCGSCSTVCPASKPGCSGGVCKSTPPLVIWSVSGDSPDYMAIKNISGKDINLSGYYIEFNDQSGTHDKYKIGNVTIKANEVMFFLEYSSCSSGSVKPCVNISRNIYYTNSRGANTYLCSGACSSTTLLDVHSYLGTGSTATPPALRYGAKFSPPQAANTVTSNSYNRKTTSTIYPNFSASDWTVSAKLFK